MDMVISLFLMSDVQLIALTFLLTGVVIYLVDYKSLRTKSANQREARFAKGASHAYIWGSLAVIIGVQVLGWLV